MLVAMPRGGDPDLILDTCSVRAAKRAGDLTGPNLMDRAKRGTEAAHEPNIRKLADTPAVTWELSFKSPDYKPA